LSCWSVRDDEAEPEMVLLNWVEQGGPPVARPQRTGFGSQVIDSILTRSINGRVTLDYDPSGLRWSALISKANLVSPSAGIPRLGAPEDEGN
jgi:two-component sensor histidine kinase